MKSLKTVAVALGRGLLLLGLLGLAASPHAVRADGGVTSQIIPVQTSTVPTSNGAGQGDTNPYGVAFVPDGFPQGTGITIHPGDVLVSNFNNSAAEGSMQATGTTIVSITPGGGQTTFFQGTPPLGLTTALAVLKRGFVLVGNAPVDSTGKSVQSGSLLVLNAKGKLVGTLTDTINTPPRFIDGPWDLTVDDDGTLVHVFLSNVLNGTVFRLDLREAIVSGTPTLMIHHAIQLAGGYLTRPDPAALVVGPTGLAYDPLRDILYVASTGDNAIFAVGDAEGATHDRKVQGTSIFANGPLNGPLALAFAPNGHLVTSNGDAFNPGATTPSEIIEFTVGGRFIGQFSIDSAIGGAFGLAFGPQTGDFVRFAAVDDALNALTVYALHVP